MWHIQFDGKNAKEVGMADRGQSLDLGLNLLQLLPPWGQQKSLAYESTFKVDLALAGSVVVRLERDHVEL
jgi:hypothetical protein